MRRLLFILVLFSQAALSQSVTVSSITFEGNVKTKISFLEKVIELEAGQSYDSATFEHLYEQSYKNLSNTDLFTIVEAMKIPSSENEVDVHFKLTERWFLFPIPYAHIHETNFNTWLKNPDLYRLSYGLDLKHYNLGGRGIQLEVLGRLGYIRAAGMGLKIPFIKESNWSIKAHGIYQEYAELVYGTRDNLRLFYRDANERRIANETKGTLQAFYNFGFNDYVAFSASARSFEIDDSLNMLNLYFPEENRKEFIMDYNLSTRFDRRDRKSYPLEGWYAHGEINLSTFESGDNYLRSNVDLRSYQRLSRKWYSGIGLKWQQVSKDAPYYLVQSLGYHELIRSFEDYVIDGSSTFLFKSTLKWQALNKELTMPNFAISHLRRIPYQIYLGVFVDAGYVSSFGNNFSNSLQDKILSGFGIGVDFTTIYDRVIRLEMSYNEIYDLGFFLHFTQAI